MLHGEFHHLWHVFQQQHRHLTDSLVCLAGENECTQSSLPHGDPFVRSLSDSLVLCHEHPPLLADIRKEVFVGSTLREVVQEVSYREVERGERSRDSWADVLVEKERARCQ